jgi:hypothetical protein
VVGTPVLAIEYRSALVSVLITVTVKRLSYIVQSSAEISSCWRHSAIAYPLSKSSGQFFWHSAGTVGQQVLDIGSSHFGLLMHLIHFQAYNLPALPSTSKDGET